MNLYEYEESNDSSYNEVTFDDCGKIDISIGSYSYGAFHLNLSRDETYQLYLEMRNFFEGN